jgi:hypothetical protein
LAASDTKEEDAKPRTYDAEFRRRVVELVRAGRLVRVVAADSGLAEATVYR